MRPIWKFVCCAYEKVVQLAVKMHRVEAYCYNRAAVTEFPFCSEFLYINWAHQCSPKFVFTERNARTHAKISTNKHMSTADYWDITTIFQCFSSSILAGHLYLRGKKLQAATRVWDWTTMCSEIDRPQPALFFPPWKPNEAKIKWKYFFPLPIPLPTSVTASALLSSLCLFPIFVCTQLICSALLWGVLITPDRCSIPSRL